MDSFWEIPQLAALHLLCLAWSPACGSLGDWGQAGPAGAACSWGACPVSLHFSCNSGHSRCACHVHLCPSFPWSRPKMVLLPLWPGWEMLKGQWAHQEAAGPPHPSQAAPQPSRLGGSLVLGGAPCLCAGHDGQGDGPWSCTQTSCCESAAPGASEAQMP